MSYEDTVLSVKRGAAFLDQEVPGWENELDLATLDLRDGCRCVVGQIFGEYELGLRFLHVTPGVHSHWQRAASGVVTGLNTGMQVDLGFFARTPGDDEWDALTEAWSSEVRGRLGI